MSDLGSLSHCMVDSDAVSIGRARRLRGKALVVSVFFEVAVVAGLLLWPLITPAVLPAQFITLTPTPPFPRVSNPQPIRPQPNDDPGPRTPITANNVSHPTKVVRQYATNTSAPSGLEGLPDAMGNQGWMPLIPGNGPELPIHRGGQRSGPLQVSTGVMEAMLIHRVQPEYPSVAKILHLTGTVFLRARVGTDGVVRQLEVVSGNPVLAEAALAAVRQWRYQPTRLSGQPVEVETEITVSFVMN